MTSPAGMPLLVIMGPTASGKSALAIAAAQRLSGEIVSADSMQVYRGLDIGVAKPTPDERRAVPHHLIDILDIGEPLEVYSFCELAEAAIRDIRSRGKLPIIAGGTGFYIKALLYGLDPIPADPALRAELDVRHSSPEGFEELKTIMADLDPEDLDRWHEHPRKLIRAFEVFSITGKSLVSQQTLSPSQTRFPVVSICLEWERETLKQRIRQRCSEMLASGWIGETERARAAGLFDSPTARQAIGYRHINDFLHGGCDMEALIDRISTSTWQYARRQLTWFRGQHPETRHIPMPCDTGSLLDSLEAELSGS